MEDTNSEVFPVAKLYLPPLTRLLNLGSDLDQLLADSMALDCTAWKTRVKRVLEDLKIEQDRLALTDRTAQGFVNCRGSRRELVTEARLREERQAAAACTPDALRKRVMRQLHVVSFIRHSVYGSSLPPFNLTDDEKAAVIDYFRHSANQERDPGRSAQSHSMPELLTDNAPRKPASDLSELLSRPNPDVLEVRLAVQEVTRQNCRRTERLSTELDRCRRELRNGERGGADPRRIRVVIVLESERAKLLNQIVRGIWRCFGGQYRFLMESKRRRSEDVEEIKDPRVDGIIRRLADEMEASSNEETPLEK